MAENKIELQLPIKIRETISKDGYVITDARDISHFFYRANRHEETKMDYDGFVIPADKSIIKTK